MDDGSDHRASADLARDLEEYFHALVRGEITYVSPTGEDEDGGIDLNQEDVDSWMNPSGDGMEMEPIKEGQTNIDDKVYTYI